MKKLYMFAVLLVLISCSVIFTVNAEAPYSYRGLSFSVPEFLKNDTQWAANANYVYAFCDSETNMEFNVSVYENEGYSNIGLDEEALESYARSLEESYDAAVTVENYRLSDGFSGVKVNLEYTQGEKGVFYWFATDELCYDLDFVFYDESYIGNAEDIMSTVVIEGTPCIDPQSVENNGERSEALTDSYIYEPVDKSYSYEGISLDLPEMLIEDKIWAQQNFVVSEWITDDMGFEVILNTDINSSPMISFADFKKSTLEVFFRGFEDSFADEITDYSWEKIECNGFGGAKLTMSIIDGDGFSYNGTVCCFSTSEKLYYVIIYEYDDSYNSYIEGIINSVRIDGKPYTEKTVIFVGICIAAVIGVAALVALVIKKKRDREAAESLQQMYMPVSGAVPLYYAPDGRPYTVQPMTPMPPQVPAGHQPYNGYVTVPDPSLNNIGVPANTEPVNPVQNNENKI